MGRAGKNRKQTALSPPGGRSMRTRERLVGATLCLCFVTGCMTSYVKQNRENEATRVASFESGCSGLQVVDRLVGSDNSIRYKLRGCGREVIYVCENSGRRHDLLDTIVIGAATIEAKCTKTSDRRLSNDVESYWIRRKNCKVNKCNPCPNFPSQEACAGGYSYECVKIAGRPYNCSNMK